MDNAQKSYSTGDLNRLAYEVNSDLDGIFSFSDKNSLGYIFDLGTDDGRESFLAFSRRLDIPQNEVSKLLTGRLRAACRYLGRVEGQGNYMITLSKFDERTPLDMGEELTHVEHYVEHDVDGDYGGKFFEPFKEFLGYLGMEHIARKYAKVNRKKIELIIRHPENAECFESDANHTIGYCVGHELLKKGDVPYKELFHATDQMEGWKIVNGIARPEIGIKVPEGVEIDEASELLKRNIGSLDARIELFR